MRYLFHACIATVVVSCSINQKELFYAEPENYSIDTIIRNYTADHTARYTGGSDLITHGSETWLMMNFCGAGKIMFLNIQADSVIEIPFYNPDCKKAYTAIKPEGIYVITLTGSIIFYEQGTAAPKILMDLFRDVPAFRASGLTPEWYKAGSDQYIRIQDHYLYFRVNKNLDDEHGFYSKYTVGYPISARLNLKTKAVDFFGKMPKYVSHGEYGLLSDIYDLYMGDSVIYSRPVNGEVTVINTKTGKTTELNIASRFQTRPIEKFRYSPLKKPIEQRERKMGHAVYSAHYEALFYNPYDEHYYRIFQPAMEKYNAEGLLNSGFDKQNVLMVFNKNLQLTEEIILPIRSERIAKLRPVQKGIEILLSDELTVGPTTARFQLLRILGKK